MKAKRRRHDAIFKSRVALEALKGVKTIQQIATEYEVHPVQVSEWKKTLLERLPEAFEGKKGVSGRFKVHHLRSNQSAPLWTQWLSNRDGLILAR